MCLIHNHPLALTVDEHLYIIAYSRFFRKYTMAYFYWVLGLIFWRGGELQHHGEVVVVFLHFGGVGAV